MINRKTLEDLCINPNYVARLPKTLGKDYILHDYELKRKYDGDELVVIYACEYQGTAFETGSTFKWKNELWTFILGIEKKLQLCAYLVVRIHN